MLFTESLVVALVYLGLLLLAVFVDRRFWGILLGQLIGHCFLAIYLTMEHNGLPYVGDTLEKTRSYNTNKAVKLIMWNMPYHAEHHAYPSVPYHALPKLRTELESELKNKELGIFEFHLRTLRQILKGQ